MAGATFELRIDASRREIAMDGDFDVAAASDLAVAIVNLQLAGSGDITIRLDDVVFMDMAGLGSIIGARNAQAERQAALLVTGATGRVRRLFDLSGLGGLFEHREPPTGRTTRDAHEAPPASAVTP